MRIRPSLRSTAFWNAVYISKIALYLLGLTNFSFILSPLAYVLQCVRLPWKIAERCYRIFAAFFTCGLFYHDSFLPGWEQLLAQRANLTGFSLSYMVDFLVSFINPLMVVGFLIIVIAAMILRKVVRVTTLIIVTMAVLPMVNTDAMRALYEQQDMIAVNQGFLNRVSRDDEAALDQRGNFTKSNLERYLNRFYEREAKRNVDFPEALEPSFNVFNVVLLTVDGFSDADLDRTQSTEHAALKRFDIVLSNFNAVTTDPQNAQLRLWMSGCGQARNEKLLIQERFEKCLLKEKLGKLGYVTLATSDDPAALRSLAAAIAEHAGEPLNTAVPEKNQDDDGSYAVRSLFDDYIVRANTSPSPLVMQMNVTMLAKASSHGDYDVRLKSFLQDVNRFVDDLEMNGRPTMLMLIPERGSGMVSDRTQMAGVMDIPSYALTHGRVFVKFVGIGGHHKSVVSDEPLSYMAVAELISRSIVSDIYNPDLMPSFLALTDGLSRTAYIGENAKGEFMIFKGRMFYKNDPDGNNWAEYQQ